MKTPQEITNELIEMEKRFAELEDKSQSYMLQGKIAAFKWVLEL